MKIFGLKTMIGVVAIAGIVQYARKQGGFGPMLDNLMNKAKTATDAARGESASRTTSDPSSRGSAETTGYGSTTYGEYGGNRTRRS